MIGLAQLRSRLREHVEHGLQIARRAADDLSTSAGRGLLLQRLGQLTCTRLLGLEQARVLDGDDGLVGEILTSSICLSVKGRTSCAKRDGADQLTVLKHRNRQSCVPLSRGSDAVGPLPRTRDPSLHICDVDGSLRPSARPALCPRRGSASARHILGKRRRPPGGRDARNVSVEYWNMSQNLLRKGASRSRQQPEHWLQFPRRRLITLETSEVAICCSSASVSSRFRACSASNSRVFSMAMTAWSAKVSRSSICCP